MSEINLNKLNKKIKQTYKLLAEKGITFNRQDNETDIDYFKRWNVIKKSED